MNSHPPDVSTEPDWRKSVASHQNGACVEVAVLSARR